MWVRKLFTERRTIGDNYKLFPVSSASPCGCGRLSAILVWFVYQFLNLFGKKSDLFIRMVFYFFTAIFFFFGTG